MFRFGVIFLTSLFFANIIFAECPLTKAIFVSEDGKDEFKVEKVAYNHIFACWLNNTKEYPPIIIERHSPAVKFDWQNMIFQNEIHEFEAAPSKCDDIREKVTFKGSYNKKPTYIVETNTSRQLPCCLTRKFSEKEFEENRVSNEEIILNIRWLTDEESKFLTYYKLGSTEIQLYNGIDWSGPKLIFKKCNSEQDNP